MNDENRGTHDKSETFGESALAPPRLMRAGLLIGEDIHDLAGIELGNVKDIMPDVNARAWLIWYCRVADFSVLPASFCAMPRIALELDAVYRLMPVDALSRPGCSPLVSCN